MKWNQDNPRFKKPEKYNSTNQNNKIIVKKQNNNFFSHFKISVILNLFEKAYNGLKNCVSAFVLGLKNKKPLNWFLSILVFLSITYGVCHFFIFSNKYIELNQLVETEQKFQKTGFFEDYETAQFDYEIVLSQNADLQYLINETPLNKCADKDKLLSFIAKTSEVNELPVGTKLQISFTKDGNNLKKLSIYWPNHERPLTFLPKGENDFFVFNESVEPISEYQVFRLTPKILENYLENPDFNNNLSIFLPLLATELDLLSDFSGDDYIDFLYKSEFRDGKPIKEATIEMAKLFIGGEEKEIYHYNYFAEDKATYFDLNGNPSAMGFLKSPLNLLLVAEKGVKKIIKGYYPNKGYIYWVPLYTPVVAVADGVVTYADWYGFEGQVLTIDHGQGCLSSYGNLSRFGRNIKNGSKVFKGQVIAYSGASGAVFTPELTFKLFLNGEIIDFAKVNLCQKLESMPPNKKVEFTALVTKFRNKLKNIMDLVYEKPIEQKNNNAA